MKINNYNEFIIENYEFINEAMLIYTNKFITALNLLSRNPDDSVSTVANFLLSVSNTEINKLVQNNIGISDKEEDKVTFIPANKIEGEGIKIMTFSYVINLGGTRDIMQYVTGVSTTRGSTYTNFKNFVYALEKDVNSDMLLCAIYDENDNLYPERIELPNNWALIQDVRDMSNYREYTFHFLENLENRDIKIIVYTHENNYNDYPTIKPNFTIPDIKPSTIKVGRFVNKIIELYFKTNNTFKELTKSDFKASDVEKFVNAYTAQIMYDTNMESYMKIVEGEEIKYWYLADNYQIVSGQLGNSCMRHDRCQGYFGIYGMNPEVCKMVILTDVNNKLVARALLWIDIDGKKWMDRIYAIKDNTLNLFNTWATNNGYEYCYGESSSKTVKIKDMEYDEFPYVDSLRWYDRKNNTLSNSRPEERPYLLLQQTDGSYSEYD